MLAHEELEHDHNVRTGSFEEVTRRLEAGFRLIDYRGGGARRGAGVYGRRGVYGSLRLRLSAGKLHLIVGRCSRYRGAGGTQSGELALERGTDRTEDVGSKFDAITDFGNTCGGSRSMCFCFYLAVAVSVAVVTAVTLADLGIGIDVNLAVALYLRLFFIAAGAQIKSAAEIKPYTVCRHRHRQQYRRHSRTGENLLKGISSHSVLNYLVNGCECTPHPYYDV